MNRFPTLIRNRKTYTSIFQDIDENEDVPDATLRQSEWTNEGFEEDDIPDSQNSSNLKSSGSLFLPSQLSGTSSECTGRTWDSTKMVLPT